MMFTDVPTRRLLGLAVAVVVGLGTQVGGQETASGKRVYISVDMEGLSGVSGSDQLGPSGAEYGRSRKLMAGDVNAAIDGARAGGAGFVLVNDSHGGMRNLLPEDLGEAVLISHSFKPYGMMEGLDETFDAVIFIGYHAKAGTPDALFAHTGSGAVRDLRVDGESVGEAGLNTLLAAWYGVPVVMASGDTVAVAQVQTAAPEARGAVVKRALNSRAVELVPLAAARAAIRREAQTGVEAARRFAPRRHGEYRVELQFNGTAHAEVAEGLPGMERPAPDTIAFTARSMPEAYRMIRILYRYINPN